MYGSSTVLDDWLKKTVVEDGCTVISVLDDSHGVPWDQVCKRNTERIVLMGALEVVDLSAPTVSKAIDLAESPFGTLETVRDQPSNTRLSLLWAQVKHSSSQERPIDLAGTSTADTSNCPDSPDSDKLQINLFPPVSVPSSSVCAQCSTPLLRSLLRSAPGYCEYSGLFICGNCFEPRPVVVPHRLLAGCLTVRGNVSVAAGQEIMQKFYLPDLSFQQIGEAMDERTHALLLAVHRLRIRWLGLASWLCQPALVKDILALLPSHIAHLEETEVNYSLGDLLDILAPRNFSVISTSLSRLVRVVEAHIRAAECCECTRSRRACTMCTKPVYMWEPEWTYCEACGTNFHRKCRQWVIDACPGCVNSRV